MTHRADISRIHRANHAVFGARKLWRQLHREGIAVGRDQAHEGAVTSVGSKGDSYDNALAESGDGLYNSELIRD